MTTLYGWGPMFGCPSASPYVMKSEIQLQMLGIEFDRAVADLESVSKHKAPYVHDEGKVIEDSNFIRAYFEEKLGKRLTAGLSEREEAASWAFERMAEGHLAALIMMERWLKEANFNKGPRLFFEDAPPHMRDEICKTVRQELEQTQIGAGFGRHSHEERLQLANWDIEAIALQLGARDFLFGDWPTAADASVAAMLISAATPYFDTPLVEMVRRHDNLEAYMERMTETFLAENKWPQMEMAL